MFKAVHEEYFITKYDQDPSYFDHIFLPEDMKQLRMQQNYHIAGYTDHNHIHSWKRDDTWIFIKHEDYLRKRFFRMYKRERNLEKIQKKTIEDVKQLENEIAYVPGGIKAVSQFEEKPEEKKLTLEEMYSQLKTNFDKPLSSETLKFFEGEFDACCPSSDESDND